MPSIIAPATSGVSTRCTTSLMGNPTPSRRSRIPSAPWSSKITGTIELAMLEHFLREDLNKRAPRVMAVLRPLRVVIDNYPEGQVEELEALNNPEAPAAGPR